MEQLSFAFLRKGQVAKALDEARTLFSAGKMRETLNNAIGILDEEFDMEGRRKALSYIEREYPTSLLTKLQTQNDHKCVVKCANDSSLAGAASFKVRCDKTGEYSELLVNIIGAV